MGNNNNKKTCTGNIVVDSCFEEATDGCGKYVMNTKHGLHQCVQHRLLRNKCMPESWNGEKFVGKHTSCTLPALDTAAASDDGRINVSLDLDGNRTVQTSSKSTSSSLPLTGIAVVAGLVVGAAVLYYAFKN